MRKALLIAAAAGIIAAAAGFGAARPRVEVAFVLDSTGSRSEERRVGQECR